MIDIHSHILSGVDDGARSMEESLKMCDIAVDNGVRDIIATPHFYYYEKIDQLKRQRDEKIKELNNRLSENKENIVVYGGFEVYCREAILHVDDFSDFTLNHSRYMLFEFDFDEPNILSVLRYIEYIESKGIVPILAHPERFAVLMDDYESINDIAARGVLFQINIGSLLGEFGSGEMRLARTMLECGFCDFLATDAHSVYSRSTNILEMIIESRINFDDDELKKMTVDNPGKVINNEKIDIRRGSVFFDAL